MITPMKQRELLFKTIQKVKRKNEITKIRRADKPDYSESSLPPMDIRKVKFRYSKPDYSHHGTPELMTEEEIIDSVINPNTHLRVKRDTITKLDPTCVSEEVKDYWRGKIGKRRYV